jgi:sugar lactone lactonase YvrE
MNSTVRIFIRGTSFALTLVSLALCGCSGMDQAAIPDTPAQGSVGSLQGSVFGGHAPIVGSHVFLLEATWTGYAAKAKSLLSSSSTATSASYPVAQDLTTGSVTNGLYYVTSDSNGAFNVTGDYTCDAGFPVYLYTSGGAPNASTVISVTGISETVTDGNYTYTFTGGNQLFTGQSVQFSSSSLAGKWATLNGTTQTVLPTPSASSFQISTTVAPGTGANTQTGSIASVGAVNPAIVNIAMLGICPGVGNFTKSIPWVYVNEVSTAAMAYAIAGFATDGMHIGTSTSNEIGLQNAALNAASLYNIQGGALELPGNSAAGQGFIANQTTVAGNGAVVPQAELDTLGNILAACVDSANTPSSPSVTCAVLFALATSTGTTSGVKPIDIATAAINMAHNPGAPNVIALWLLSSGVVPFAPQLTSPPNDFTVAITYNNITAPGSLAIDASGNAFVPTNSSAGYVTKLSPAGAVLATSATGGSGFDSIAVAPNGSVFVAANSSNTVYAYDTNLNNLTGSPWSSAQMNNPTSVAIDSSGDVYVTHGGNSDDVIQKFNSSGSLIASMRNSCLTRVTQIAIDPSDTLWASMYTSNDLCRVSNPSGNQLFSTSGQPSAPTNVAIDSSGNGWAAAGAQANLFMYSPSGDQNSYGVINNATQGGLSSPTFIAIDGGNNVWLTNNGNSYALSEFTHSGTAITNSAGYQSGNLNTPSSWIAIDASGDVWVPNQGADSVTELIGVATPTVTPLSALQPGVRP